MMCFLPGSSSSSSPIVVLLSIYIRTFKKYYWILRTKLSMFHRLKEERLCEDRSQYEK